jgi:hypothetical protein
MFYDRPDCITYSKLIDAYGTPSGVFLLKNVISPELIKKIEDDLNSVEENTWENKSGLIDWYVDKSVEPSVDTTYIWEEISKILYPSHVLHPQAGLLKVKPGDDGMFIHADSPGKGACHLLSQRDTWATCCELDYGVVAYLGDWEGGAVFYPNINPDGTIKDHVRDGVECLEVMPEKGDVVIHSAFDPYAHGVREVTSGIRYAFSNFSLKAIDNPGSFYNYGTPEYFEQIGNSIVKKSVTDEQLKEWLKPLKINPQFTEDAILEMQKSGLKGEELAEAFFSDMKE